MTAEGSDAAVPALKLIPATLKTPRLFGANRPLESRPPTAPGPPETLFDPEFGRLAGVLPSAGFIAPGIPPGAPIPVLPIPDAADPPPTGCVSGVAEAVAAFCETAIACTVTFTGISSPFFKMALSNAIPIDKEESPRCSLPPSPMVQSRRYGSGSLPFLRLVEQIRLLPRNHAPQGLELEPTRMVSPYELARR